MISTPQFIKEFMFGMKWKNNKKDTGFTIIEIVVAIAIIVLILGTILGFFILDSRIAERDRMRLKAISIAEEAIEAVRNFRDNTTWASDGIGSLMAGVDYYPTDSGTDWDIVLGTENINGFTRKVVFNRVSRDIDDNVEAVYNPVNDDSNTRKITVTISWTDRYGDTNEELITYITNWRE